MRLIVLDCSQFGNGADARSDAVLVACARERGIDAQVLTFAGEDDAVLPSIRRDNVVLVRADLRTDEDLSHATQAVWALERRGVRCLPSAEGLVASEDKLRTFLRLRSAGIPTPSTVAMFVAGQDPGDVAALHERLHAFPLVLKRPVDWGGRTVVKCDDGAALRAALGREQTERPDGAVLVQPYFEHVRAVTARVAGGRVVGTWGARPAPGEFRTCPALGGIVETAALDDEGTRHAAAAVEACALRFATVDFLEAASGERVVIDVNAMPSLRPEDAGDRAFAAAVVALAAGDP